MTDLKTVMEAHRAKVRKAGKRFRIACSCGWTSDALESASHARAAHELHLVHSHHEAVAKAARRADTALRKDRSR